MTQPNKSQGPKITRIDKHGTTLPPGVQFGEAKDLSNLAAKKVNNEAAAAELEEKKRGKERMEHIINELEVIVRVNRLSLAEASHIFQFFINFYMNKSKEEYLFKRDVRSDEVKDNLHKNRKKIMGYMRDAIAQEEKEALANKDKELKK